MFSSIGGAKAVASLTTQLGRQLRVVACQANCQKAGIGVQGIRGAVPQDLIAIQALLLPLEEKGILAPRSNAQLLSDLRFFRVAERDANVSTQNLTTAAPEQCCICKHLSHKRMLCCCTLFQSAMLFAAVFVLHTLLPVYTKLASIGRVKHHMISAPCINNCQEAGACWWYCLV